ncbi:hypothetical protein POG22_07955 [Geitlerinema sp. CS-897]|uniref:hypothetical protein n=1 Tax=Baaleninema simplex TaxID=2862350 RepID=UPI00034AB440|nr:hypothetical protein [Baaleninema simplex]MDC0832944.1 hypothetical protein [Geitlerinema sp. CS-897]
MEPIEWGLVAIAAVMLKKAAETTSETVTKDMLAAALPPVKSAATKLSTQLRDRVSQFGDRVQKRLPAEANPFDNPELLAEMVEVEVEDPEMAAVVEEVEAQLPPIEIKIDRRKQQGIVINDSATANFNQKIEQNFS